jgi:tRNA threonylcarbamoyladenosine biosynthesis protein TsaB
MALNLVIDTAMAGCSVGLFDGDVALFEQSLLMRHGHQEALGGLVIEALTATNHWVSDLDTIAVTLGPGSFTGLRIGLSFAKGLAVGADVKLVGLSALEAMLFHPDITGQKVMAIMDGGRGKLFVQSREGEALSAAIIVDSTDEGQNNKLRVAAESFGCVTGNGLSLEALFVQTHPHVQALNRLLQLGQGREDLTPLYMREADASVSQKPILQL